MRHTDHTKAIEDLGGSTTEAATALWHNVEGIGLVYDGGVLDVGAWQIVDPKSPVLKDGLPLGPQAALTWAASHAPPLGLRHLVVGVIGPREASNAQKQLATELGRRLARLTLTTVCGGRGGVMEAVCQGVMEEGGLSLGFLPGFSPDDANPHVAIPLPTGLSEGRNMVIARASRVLIAIGGSYGTLTEIAFGLHFGKRVIGLDTAPAIDGLTLADGLDEAVDLTCEALLQAAVKTT